MTAIDISENVYTEIFNNYEEARQHLFKLYNKNYQILDKHPTLDGGFFGFGQKQKLSVTYKILDRFNDNELFSRIPQKREETHENVSFDKNKEELLKNLQAQSGQPVLQTQMNELVRQISELNSKIDSQQSTTIVTTAEDHINIQKIEDLLAKNEFT